MPVCLTTITTDCLSLLISNPPSSTSQISKRTVMSYKVNIWSYKIKMTDFILSAGGYFEMLRSGWSRRDHPDLMMFWYEEIKLDQKFWVKTILKHVGYALSEEKINELCEALTFKSDVGSIDLKIHCCPQEL